MGLKLLASADRGGAMTKGWRGTEADSEVGTERRARWPAAMYGRSCGPTGVSTRCARPTHVPSMTDSLDDSCRAGFAPAEERRLSRRTLTERLQTPRPRTDVDLSSAILASW